MDSSSSSFKLDPLDDDDPFFLSFLAETGLSQDQLVVPEPCDELQATKKRKTGEGTAGASDLSFSSSSSLSTAIVTIPDNASVLVPHNEQSSAKTCRLVSTRGEVRGDTLIEHATNVVADKINQVAFGSNSSSDQPVRAERAEIVSRTSEDVELATIPRQLSAALDDLDTDRIRHVLDTYFDENCIFASAALGVPQIVGRENVYQFLCKSTERNPDAVRVVRHSRVVVDEAGNKAVKFKQFVTTSYITDRIEGAAIPSVSISTVIQHLDESAISKKEIAKIKKSFATAGDTKVSFSALAHASMSMHLNAQGKVSRFDHDAKVLNLKPLL